MILLRNIGILLVAIGLAICTFPIGLLTTLLFAIRKGSAVKPVNYLSDTVLSIALSIDLLGNVVCKDFFNHTLIKPNSYPFGNNRDTISYVLGKNKALGLLTDWGRAMANLLNWLDKDHVERAAGIQLNQKG